MARTTSGAVGTWVLLKNEVSDVKQYDTDVSTILKYLGIIDDKVVFIIFKLLGVLWGTDVIFIMFENDITKLFLFT